MHGSMSIKSTFNTGMINVSSAVAKLWGGGGEGRRVLWQSRTADSGGDKVNTLNEKFDLIYSTHFKLLNEIKGTVINWYDFFSRLLIHVGVGNCYHSVQSFSNVAVALIVSEREILAFLVRSVPSDTIYS